ncbi:MAG TPA: cell surface protein SprA [Gemmatimonadales bacterium]|nr:cell surface protein SprA [Gemmatimonadales bacterium]
MRSPLLTPPRHAALAPGGRLGSRVPPALIAAAWVDAVLAARRPALAPATGTAALAAAAPGPEAAAPAPPRPFQAAGVTGLLGPYADLGMQLNLRFELKADQFRNLRCSSEERRFAISGCNAGFPTISPNPQYAIRTAGVVGQRLHINVDFDSQREFDANNNLQVWYEGLEDEILRRVEAGNVTFQAPPSRFISAAIPANNFGVQAIAQVGPLEFRGIFAQQKGNVVKDRFYTVGETTSQPIDREARDLDYEPGRFFFVIDPAALPGYPAVDILALDETPRPDALTVGNLHVYRRRAVATGSAGNQNAGGVRAVACGATAVPIDCPVQREGPFEWEILQEGKDYYVDASGTWFALANRLDQNDYLAVSYITASGADSIGTFPVAAKPDTLIDTLRLVYDPKPGVTAASPSFRFEIRSAYRVGGSEVDRQSVDLALTVNRRERSANGQTYLALLGLALENDPNRFDQYNRLFPRARDPNQGAPVRDYFAILPHLTPFADSTRLAPSERNDSLYRTPRLYLATQGPPSVFAVRLHVEADASADRSVLALNSFQIREGSERIYVRNTLLTRNADYTIDYTTGQVQFKNSDSLFQGGVAQVRAQFEERAAFTIAPTSIYGLAARYDLGTVGQVNFTGMFQKEQSTFNRPPLGFEPSSSFIGGLSTDLRFQPAWLTRLADALPGVRTDAPSFLNVSAEVALSKPSPNRFGQAYLEEFETEASRFIALAEGAWHWGSVPTSVRGAEPFLDGLPAFDPVNAAFLTWQGLPYNVVNNRFEPIQFLPQEIDPTIRFAGQTQVADAVLWLMLKPDTVMGLANDRPGSPSRGLPNWVRPAQNAPRWRSLTQTLSPTGVDLSRVEFLEFWVWEDAQRVAKANRAAVLFDFGSVFEDALAFEPEAFRVDASGDTTYSGVRPAGEGRLDTERDPRTQTWSATVNDEGILSDRVVDGIVDSTSGGAVPVDTLPLCSATAFGQLIPYAFGDLRSRCGRHNGVVDTEDQDGDFALDSVTGVKTAESFVRYVFPIGDERFYVRDGGMTPDPAGGTAGWRLYRIPFRTDSLQVGQPNLRQVQALRITIVTPATVAPGQPDPQVYFALARVRLVGSSWVKRADTPIGGLGGDRGTGVGEVVASVVSTENRDLGYVSPPGVGDQAGRRDASFQLGSTQINERSMRLLASGLAPGTRAEAYLRFTTEGDKNFLKYKKLRLWARGRGPGWEDGDLEFLLKVGKDQDNFYLYHTPARTASWEPEVVVDFNRWLALRGRIEQAWLRGDTARVYRDSAGVSVCPDSVLVPHDSSYVMCDGPYLVHVRDPGTAPPNLARVQEIAAGIWRVNDRVFVDQAEVWVDDIRLSDVVQDVGMAGAVDLSLSAADVADVAVSVSRRDGQFRQLGDDPTYTTDAAASVAGTLRLDRFLPERWGLSAPLTVRYTRAASDPFYVNRTDLRADALTGLRTPRASATTYSVALRRVQRAGDRLGRWLLDPVAVSGTYASGAARADLSQATSSNYAVNLDYTLLPGPAALRIGKTRLRVNPSAVRLRSGVAGSDAERFTYAVPVPRPGDTLPPAVSRTRLWRNSASVDLLPLTGVLLRVDAASTRDLRDYGDSTTIGRLFRQGRASLLGQDIGVETQRTLNTLVTVTPRIGVWLRPRASLTSSFSATRDPNARQPVRDIGDTAGAFRIPSAFSNLRRVEAGTQIDPRRLAQVAFGDSARVARWLGRITTVDLSYNRQRVSSFNRAGDFPSFGYQLALGGPEDFRRAGGLLATSAAENAALNAGGSVVLPLGIRVNATYRRTTGISWALRSGQQVPIRTRTRDWPNGTLSWSHAPSRRNLGRLLTSLTTQVTVRRSETANEQPTFGSPTSVAVTRATERSFGPSMSLTWTGGVLTTFDASTGRSEQLAAGNLFRSRRSLQNAALSFTFQSPVGGAGPRRPRIRTTTTYSVIDNTTCLRTAGEAECVPYVDSRQVQAQLTMDTDLPPNMSAGFQMAYLLNEERHSNRKVAQMVITAFVQLSTSAGNIR